MQNYFVANDQGQFHTGAGDDTWSVDQSLAQNFSSPAVAKSTALRENSFVLPQSWLEPTSHERDVT